DEYSRFHKRLIITDMNGRLRPHARMPTAWAVCYTRGVPLDRWLKRSDGSLLRRLEPGPQAAPESGRRSRYRHFGTCIGGVGSEHAAAILQEHFTEIFFVAAGQIVIRCAVAAPSLPP